MATQTSMLHVRVDEKLKADATETLASVGLTVSDAVRAGLRRFYDRRESLEGLFLFLSEEKEQFQGGSQGHFSSGCLSSLIMRSQNGGPFRENQRAPGLLFRGGGGHCHVQHCAFVAAGG